MSDARDDAGDSVDPWLPPPFFPPGSTLGEDLRRHLEGGADVGVPDDAFHDPDDPVVRERPPTVPADFEEVMGRVGGLEAVLGHVAVTGMGNDPHVVPQPGLEPYDDPHVAELASALERLRTGLASRGEAALKVEPEMSRFEATLRAYCVGYLAGRRAQDS
ncbi:MAG TPA: hypothetical protein VK858_00575 [Longimicrobiales bacterium]|nr:hypothetical protein [Longimicrobiales bacterium]